MSGVPASEGVSVVMPCYNAASTIARALASIASQTLPPMEVIVVDDASRDGTLSVVREFAEDHRDLRIRLLTSSHNAGPADTRNRGIAEASGEYIAFLDADDTWHRRKLELHRAWMDANPYALASGHRYLVLSPDETLDDVSPDLPATPAAVLLRRRLVWRNFFSTSTAMARRVPQLRFPTHQRYGEDFTLWLSLALNGHCIALLDVPLAALYKPAFGHSGLSNQRWQMERAELASYRRLGREGLLAPSTVAVALILSMLKAGRRELVVLGRRIHGGALETRTSAQASVRRRVGRSAGA